MKKNVLCLFSLILYGLLACTILSTRIQEEMTTLVRVEDRIASKRDPKTISLNSRSLFEKNRYPIAEDGYYLFEIADRGGWSPGIRTHPVPEYTFQGETAVVYVHIDRNYTFVRAASRNPLPGKLAQPVKYFQRGADTNLLIYGRAFPKTREMPPGYTLAGEGDHALLLKTTQGSFPFLPHYLRTANMTTDFAQWVFSLTEAKTFLSVVPNAAVIGMSLLGVVLLWVFSCVLAVHADNHKWLLALNGLLALASLALIWYIPLDFPASMLPPASILDWDYYRSEFSVLLTGLANFPEELAPMQAAITQMQGRCRTVFRIGLAVPALLILAEAILPTLAARKASNPQPQLPEA